MALRRGEVHGYDFNRMVVEFTMLNKEKVVRCAISTAAMVISAAFAHICAPAAHSLAVGSIKRWIKEDTTCRFSSETTMSTKPSRR